MMTFTVEIQEYAVGGALHKLRATITCHCGEVPEQMAIETSELDNEHTPMRSLNVRGLFNCVGDAIGKHAAPKDYPA